MTDLSGRKRRCREGAIRWAGKGLRRRHALFQHAVCVRRLHRQARSLRNELEDVLLIIDLRRAGTRGAVVLALEGDAVAFFLGVIGSGRRGDGGERGGERTGKGEGGDRGLHLCLRCGQLRLLCIAGYGARGAFVTGLALLLSGWRLPADGTVEKSAFGSVICGISGIFCLLAVTKSCSPA